MSYLVLARKWRPQKFADVIGQGHVVHTLQNAVKKDRLAHAFLFTGARGVGKTTAARLLAKALQCEQGPTAEPCGTCSHCVEIADSRSVDVLEIDGASNRGIDQVRELRDGVRYLPQSARYKIIIIDEVHMLTTEAFNALLKTLEEPPEHVKFIFATTEPHKIPITSLSRCQRFDFKRIATGEIVKHLRRIIDAEKIPADDEALHQIARAGQGSMRDALSLMDQAIAFADEAVTAEVASEALGIIDRRVIVAIVEAVLAQDSDASLKQVTKAFASGADLRQLLSDIVEELRHLIVAQAVREPGALIDLPEQEIALLQQRAAAVPAEDLQRLFAMAREQVDVLARAESPRMILDVLIARMAAMPAWRSLDELSALIDRLQGKAGAQVPRRAAPRSTASPRVADSASASAPQSEKVSAPAGVLSASVKSQQARSASPDKSSDDSSVDAAAKNTQPSLAPQKTVTQDQAVAQSDVQSDKQSDKQSEKQLEEPVVAESVSEEPVAAGAGLAGKELPGVDPRWQAVVEQVRAQNPAAASFVEFGSVDIADDGARVCLRFAQRFYMDALRDPEKFKVLNEAAQAQFANLKKIEIEYSSEAEANDATLSMAAAKTREAEDARAALESEALANPTVRLAIKMFNAKVLEVKAATDEGLDDKTAQP